MSTTLVNKVELQAFEEPEALQHRTYSEATPDAARKRLIVSQIIREHLLKVVVLVAALGLGLGYWAGGIVAKR